MVMENSKATLKLRRLGICTSHEAIIYLSNKSYICTSEGFDSASRIQITTSTKKIVAILNIVQSDLLQPEEASLSEYAWKILGAHEGDKILLSHPKPSASVSFIRSKIYGHKFSEQQFATIIADVIQGNLSKAQTAAFVSACAGNHLDRNEILYLTRTMLQSGNTITWPESMIVDKHCLGGIPGNRTTMIIVPIVAAFGLTIPKTSSRAITSAAGTADAMEVLAPVNLTFDHIQQVVSREHGCIVWGGTSALSPADDILIRVERDINLNGEGQMIASVLSKKLASGAKQLLLDIPIGKTAKVHNYKQARHLRRLFRFVGNKFGLDIKVCFTNGTEPVGFGIGPALEAQDVVDVLQNKTHAPQDLKQKSLFLAGKIIDLSKRAKPHSGFKIAQQLLESGQAWKKFQHICEAQGGMQKIPIAKYTHDYLAPKSGIIHQIDNRHIAKLAKLAGAPADKAAGLYLHKKLHNKVTVQEPILTLHAESEGELNYALDFLESNSTEIISIK